MSQTRPLPALLTTTVCAALFAGACLFNVQAAEKPKHSMEDIMKKGLKGEESTLKKVLDGKATDADTRLLLEYVKALALHEPSKGDMASWKQKTSALIAVTQKVANGDKSAIPQLKEASNCKACHTAHRKD